MTRLVIVQVEDGNVSEATVVGDSIEVKVLDWDELSLDPEAAREALNDLEGFGFNTQLTSIRSHLNDIIDEEEDALDDDDLFDEDTPLDDDEDDEDDDDDWEDDDGDNDDYGDL